MYIGIERYSASFDMKKV